MLHSSVVFWHCFCSHDGIPAHFFLLWCPSGPELPFSPTLYLPRLSPMWSVTPFPSNCCHMYSLHGVCCKICDKRETSPTMHCYLRLGCSSDPCLVADKCDKCIYIHRSWSLLACELVMLYPRQYNHSHLIMNCQLLSLLPWEYKSFRVTQLLKRLLLYCVTNIHASFL